MLLVWNLLAMILLGQNLRLEHVANAGVLVSCGEESVLVDALFRVGVEGYETHTATQREQLEQAQPPYHRVRVILATHRHRDHFDAQAIARHLQHNSRAVFAGTPQTVSEVRSAGADRVDTVPWGEERR